MGDICLLLWALYKIDNFPKMNGGAGGIKMQTHVLSTRLPSFVT